VKVLIVEDEPQAVQLLESLLAQTVPDLVVAGKVDSVTSAVNWFASHPPPDIAFFDIQLGDGLSFEIFERCRVSCPVIFTTAYDEYALKAFKVNSIDYLLKPLDKAGLTRALEKLKGLSAAASHETIMQSIGRAMELMKNRYKTRFVVKVGEHLRTIEVDDVLYFLSQEKTTFSHTRDGRRHILDFTLDEVEEKVDPSRFFRINRKYIVALDSIQDMIAYTNSRLRLILKNCDDQEVIVARERVQEFKEWLDR
jgi:DNA-binding LytR/AlgR family response regulator